ncbi:MAG: MFS transporter [Anaerolineae bacterium]|nr:MFS transporter [Anaerolineae bacterium]
MATASDSVPHAPIDDTTYKRRIRAWTLYDWANSAFYTTILAAVLPVYFSQVAGATLPSEATATAYWSLALSFALLISAVLSPILGTVSDVMRGKKRFLAYFTTLGVIAVGFMVLVDRGDWALALVLIAVARIAAVAAGTFYDSLLPHVAREEDRDVVSARGYALGYLGGGLLLAINVVMIFVLPGTWGPRLSFLTVAIWWAVFSIPILRQVPEPPADTSRLEGRSVIAESLARLGKTFKDIRHYSELFKYLVAFLIYNDAIGTIITIAVIYGAELGFGDVELILALLLVQFVGIPFSLIFGRLPDAKNALRPVFLAFILFNLVALPIVGIAGRQVLAETQSGAPPAPFEASDGFVGQGHYSADDASIVYDGEWASGTISAVESGLDADAVVQSASAPGARVEFPFNGQELKLIYNLGPDQGRFDVLIDGAPAIDPDTDGPLVVDAYSAAPRYGEFVDISAEAPGQHTLTLVVSEDSNPASSGNGLSLSAIDVQPPARESSLPLIIAVIVAVQIVAGIFAWLLGKPLFSRLAATLDTRRSILLALGIYTVIAIWGFFLDSTVEFWCLAWLVAIVQGGSQALSRSLFSSLSPAAKSGEFFGFYGVMEKFSAIIGPLIFAAAVAIFGQSRPAIISLCLFFAVGGWLLTRVNIAEGQRVAREEDAALAARGA